MKTKTVANKGYNLPDSLTIFQKELYEHLIEWKWKHITTEPGTYKRGEKVYEHDAILPLSVHDDLPLIYPKILADLKKHKVDYPFKYHKHFYHMASSQAANINLFIPILLSPKANDILRLLKPDFKELATSELDRGFRIEYWDGNSDKEKGLLGDHNSYSGTDSDIAIAYYNHSDELCLWLIEHKLSEKEFTECGAYKSIGNKSKHMCDSSFDEIVNNKNLCYYHRKSKYNYWNITDKHQSFFVNHKDFESCPFRRGMNQLWRNQMLALALESDENNDFKNVCFSVVHHPDNHSLDKSIQEYKTLIDNNPKFSTFTSKDVVDIASKVEDEEIQEWVEWYKGLYRV